MSHHPLVWISDDDQSLSHAAKVTGTKSFVWRSICDVSFSYPSMEKAAGKTRCGICKEIEAEGPE